MTQKKRIREDIEIQYQEKTYRGTRVIEGTRKLDQYIVYEGRCLPDLKNYSPDDKNTIMLSVAKLMLSELVSGRTISAQPCSKFGL